MQAAVPAAVPASGEVPSGRPQTRRLPVGGEPDAWECSVASSRRRRLGIPAPVRDIVSHRRNGRRNLLRVMLSRAGSVPDCVAMREYTSGIAV